MNGVPWWASDDPWAMSPAEEEAARQRQREIEAQLAALPDEPPY